jgi:hypothetical protein
LPEATDVVAEALCMNGQRSRTGFGSISHSVEGWHLSWTGCCSLRGRRPLRTVLAGRVFLRLFTCPA